MTSNQRSPLIEGSKDGFSVNQDGLKELMSRRKEELVTYMSEKHGGVQGLCAALKTSPNNGMFCLATKNSWARQRAMLFRTVLWFNRYILFGLMWLLVYDSLADLLLCFID